MLKAPSFHLKAEIEARISSEKEVESLWFHNPTRDDSSRDSKLREVELKVVSPYRTDSLQSKPLSDLSGKELRLSEDGHIENMKRGMSFKQIPVSKARSSSQGMQKKTRKVKRTLTSKSQISKRGSLYRKGKDLENIAPKADFDMDAHEHHDPKLLDGDYRRNLSVLSPLNKSSTRQKGISIKSALKLLKDAHRGKIINMCVFHVFFIAVYLVLLLLLNDHEAQFLQTDAILEALIRQPLNESEQIFDTFETLTNAEDISLYLKGAFKNAIYSERYGDSFDNFDTQRAYFLSSNQILGKIRTRTVFVEPQQCPPITPNPNNLSCYPKLAEISESEAKRIIKVDDPVNLVINGSEFGGSSRSNDPLYTLEIKSHRFNSTLEAASGYYQYLGRNGYQVNFPNPAEKYANIRFDNIVDTMFESDKSHWASRGIRAFSIDINFQNYDTELFTVLRMTIQLMASGNIRTDTRVYTFDLQVLRSLYKGFGVARGENRSSNNLFGDEARRKDITIFVLQLVYYVLCVLRLFDFVHYCYFTYFKAKFDWHRLNGSMVVEFLILFIMIWQFVQNILLCDNADYVYSMLEEKGLFNSHAFNYTNVTQSIFAVNATSENNFVDCFSVGNLYGSFIQRWSFFMTICLCFRLLDFLSTQKQFAVLLQTLMIAFTDLLVLVITIFFILAAFSFAGVFLYGSRVRDYHTLASSLSSMARILLGYVDYESMLATAPYDTMTFYLLYMVSLYFFLTNVFIGILTKYFDITHEAYLQSKIEGKDIGQELISLADITEIFWRGIYFARQHLSKLYLPTWLKARLQLDSSEQFTVAIWDIQSSNRKFILGVQRNLLEEKGVHLTTFFEEMYLISGQMNLYLPIEKLEEMLGEDCAYQLENCLHGTSYIKSIFVNSSTDSAGYNAFLKATEVSTAQFSVRKQLANGLLVNRIFCVNEDLAVIQNKDQFGVTHRLIDVKNVAQMDENSIEPTKLTMIFVSGLRSYDIQFESREKKDRFCKLIVKIAAKVRENLIKTANKHTKMLQTVNRTRSKSKYTKLLSSRARATSSAETPDSKDKSSSQNSEKLDEIMSRLDYLMNTMDLANPIQTQKSRKHSIGLLSKSGRLI
eukprot:g1250.t1